jgi:hypothetical protein
VRRGRRCRRLSRAGPALTELRRVERTQDLKELNSVDFTQTANPIMVSVGRARARARHERVASSASTSLTGCCASTCVRRCWDSRARFAASLLRARLRADRVALARQGAASAKALTWIVSFKGDTARQAWR